MIVKYKLLFIVIITIIIFITIIIVLYNKDIILKETMDNRLDSPYGDIYMYMKKLSNRYKLLKQHIFIDIIINSDLIPINDSDINIFNSIKFNGHYLSSDDNNFIINRNININLEIINLDTNYIYFVISSIYYNQFFHFFEQFVGNLEIYLLYYNKFKIICNESYNSGSSGEIFNMIINYFNLKDKIIFTNSNHIYKGNFLYVALDSTNETKYNNPSITQYDIHENIIVNRLIEEANKKYKDTITYDKIWISRRNIDNNNNWNKRYIININDISDVIFKYNFIELHFGEKDIDLLKQIYLVNNASVIFSEPGSSYVNIKFMKKNTYFITMNIENCNSQYLHTINFFSRMKQVKTFRYDSSKIIEDTKNKYYQPLECNSPIKIVDVNDFIQWFTNIMKQI